MMEVAPITEAALFPFLIVVMLHDVPCTCMQPLCCRVYLCKFDIVTLVYLDGYIFYSATICTAFYNVLSMLIYPVLTGVTCISK